MNQTKYKDEVIFQVYDFARQGHTPDQIAGQIGLDKQTFKKWRTKYPLIQKALDCGGAEGRGAVKKVESFPDYVYKQLSPELQAYWDQLKAFEKAPSGVERMEALLQDGGINVRKALFVHALVCCSFNASRACRKVNIHVSTMNDWMANDPKFRELIDEQMQWHKGNFFEEALFNRVKAGDTAAVIFANKTFNKGRGYDTKITVENSTTVEHRHSFTITDLPPKLQIEVLKALDDKRKALALPEHVDDAEIINGD